MEIDLEHVAAIQIRALLQLNGHRLDKAHQNDDRKAQVARNLRQDGCQQTEPTVARSRDSQQYLHAEHGDNR